MGVLNSCFQNPSESSVNDLPQKVKSHCVLFADDAKLFKELKQLKDFEEIQDDLYELCVWASKWLLFF